MWRKGGIDDGYRAVGMQRMLDGLRSSGFKGLAIVTGNHWGDTLVDIANNPLKNDGNVVYSGHTYPYWCGSHLVLKEEPYMCQGRQRPPFFESNFQPLIGKRPVIIGEFGTQRNIDGENRQVIQWAEDHKIGWLAWQWAAGKIENYTLLQPDGDTPTAQGKPVRDFLLKSQGWSKPNNGK